MKHLKKAVARVVRYFPEDFEELLAALDSVTAARDAFLDRAKDAPPGDPELARLKGALGLATYREHDAAFGLGSAIRAALKGEESDAKARGRARTKGRAIPTAQDVRERVAP